MADRSAYMALYRRRNADRIRESNRQWRGRNADKVKVYRRTNRQKYKFRDAEKNRGRKLKYDFGITLEQYNSLLALQNGVCAICKQLSKQRRLAVDHNHLTNQVRGLLCTRCNWALGQFEENIEYLATAIDYLKHYQL